MAVAPPPAYAAPAPVTVNIHAPAAPAPTGAGGTPNTAAKAAAGDIYGNPATAADANSSAIANSTDAPPISLGADPAYNAFLASLGLTDANLRDAAALRAGNATANLGPAVAQNDLNTADATKRTGQAYGGRGLYNSSDRLNAQGKIQAAGAGRDAALQNQLAASLASMYNSMGLSVAQSQAKAAQQAQASAGRQALQGALQGPNPFVAMQASMPTGIA